jgi:hypothetical protein
MWFTPTLISRGQGGITLGLELGELGADFTEIFTFPLPTPLLPALTLSAGEYKVSGGELKVSRQVGLPRNPRARRSKPKMASLYV